MLKATANPDDLAELIKLAEGFQVTVGRAWGFPEYQLRIFNPEDNGEKP